MVMVQNVFAFLSAHGLLILGYIAALLVDTSTHFPAVQNNPVFKALNSVVSAILGLFKTSAPTV